MNKLFYEEIFRVNEEKQILRKYVDVFLSDLHEYDTRNVAIISNRICVRKGHKYLEIIGLDIFSGKIISLIDNHGKIYGLCSYSENWARLKPKTVIKVPVELCETVFVQTMENQNIQLFNALRIKGEYKILGTTNWVTLMDKYKEVQILTGSDSFELIVDPVTIFKVFELFKNCENSSIYIPVRFPGTHRINISGSNVSLYNPETEKSFNFISSTKKLLDNSGKYLNGLVIAKVIVADNKTTVLIDSTIICEYYQYSKTERNNNLFKKLQQRYEEKYSAAIESYPMSYPMYISDDHYTGEEDDYSDKYKLYDSMEEYCDEYESLRELEAYDEDYFWYEED